MIHRDASSRCHGQKPPANNRDGGLGLRQTPLDDRRHTTPHRRLPEVYRRAPLVTTSHSRRRKRQEVHGLLLCCRRLPCDAPPHQMSINFHTARFLPARSVYSSEELTSPFGITGIMHGHYLSTGMHPGTRARTRAKRTRQVGPGGGRQAAHKPLRGLSKGFRRIHAHGGRHPSKYARSHYSCSIRNHVNAMTRGLSRQH